VDFDWGDSNILYGDSALAGGETLRARHAFEAPGSYHIRAQAWDVSDGRESDWSPEHVLEVKNTSGHGWERTHAARSARSVARAADGGFAMTGRSDSGLVLAKTDASGNLLWMRNYGDTIGPMGFSVRQTADGGYIVVSTTQGPWALNGVYLTRTDATGNPVWQRAYYEGEGEFPGPYGRCVRPTPDGGYVIAASELVMKTDSAGDSVWAKPHPGNAVELTPDGGYIICGGSNDGAHLIKTDALGNVQWDRIYSGEGLGFSAVQLTSDGGYMIAGSVVHQDGELAHLAKLDGAGVLIWERDFDGMGGAVGYDLALASDGGCYLVGTTYDADYTYYAYLVRTDRIGNTVWERVWCGSGEEDGGYAVIASPDGGCLVAGTRDDQAVLFKVDPQGGSGPTWFGRGHQPNAKKGVAFGGKMRDTHFRLPARPGMTR
jgi:WD40 repeat protein